MIVRSVARSTRTFPVLLNCFRCLHITPSAIKHHDIRKVFDDQNYWREINAANYGVDTSMGKGLLSKFPPSTSLETGLFQNPFLISPQGLRKFSFESLSQAQALVEEMRTNRSSDDLKLYISKLDRLSDILCRVIDLCEFIRASHPNSQYVKAAQQCHEEMFEFMNILNTDTTLCEILKQVIRDKLILGALTSEEVKVGKILLDDFEKSGIDMAPEVREQFISLSQQISLVGQEFINNTEFVRTNYIKIKCKTLEYSGINPLILKQLSRDIKGQHYKVPTYGFLAYSILRSCPDEDVRREIWTAMHDCSDKQISRLTQLVRLRASLAKIMGKSSFSQYQLEGKMAKSPKYVNDFLQSLVNVTRPKAAEELRIIADLKSKHLKIPHPKTEEDILKLVRPWDREFYSTIYALQQQRKTLNDEQLSSYFSLGAVMRGLSDLFQSIYGIRLEPVVPMTGETWSPEVRRVNVVDEMGGLIGVVYCDLFEREGKTSNPAHFTVCCSRQIYPDEKDLSTIQVGHSKQSGELFQLPVISLVCNFSITHVLADQALCLLHLNDVETLFHEMGHAMHSMLGRTSLQNISGTRCATDFVELPSILMEHFAKDFRVLSKISSHYESNEKVPHELLKLYQTESNYLQHTETFSQAKMAILDQVMHSEEILKNMHSTDVVEMYHTLERKMNVLADDQSTWCGKFGHLFGYGATYYSYLFDRAIASKIWLHLFAEDPYCRASGQKFKESVLKWGGSRDPWECIADALDNKELSKGDEKAMEFIGDTTDI